MDPAANGGAPSVAPSLGTRRACDQCRLRKIRCDKESPCSNCRAAKRTCSSTGLGQKPKEPKQRVLISTQYEQKIDDMQQRLQNIEALLRNLSLPSHSSIPQVQLQGAPHRENSCSTPETERNPTVSPPSSTLYDPAENENFEGTSSLAAHAAFASELVENAVQSNINVASFNRSNPRMEAALSSLRQMVDLHHSKVGSGIEERWPTQKMVLPRGRLRDLPMPPIEFVMERLTEMKWSPGPMLLLIVTCFTSVDQFIERCRRLYFCTDDSEFSESLFIIVNAGLIYLFMENALNAPEGSAEKSRLQSCYEMCQTNVETALANLPLLMPASLETAEALVMGASVCVDLSRPSLAWLLVSRAGHMCRTLGLHQESSMRNDPPEVRRDKALLFWSTYMLDKGLSLRLGRASVLQDYDISLPAVLQETHREGPSTALLSLWIKHAEVQGKIYQRLYSPGALRQTDEGRREQVRLLIADLEFLLTETMKLVNDMRSQPDAGKEAKMFELTLKSDEVTYLSSMALTYRAMPPSATGTSRTFADACLGAARTAMRAHEEAMSMMGDKSLKLVYLHWTILYAPFIPFVVIFCHVIESSDPDDLRRLELFVQSLQSSCDISPAIDKLHHLSRVLYNVALLYIEAKSQELMGQDMVPVGNEFDMYLNQLGFMPMTAMDPSVQGMAGGGGAAAVNANGVSDDVSRSAMQMNQLGDWFSGGNHILGLVEEDLSGLSSMQW